MSVVYLMYFKELLLLIALICLVNGKAIDINEAGISQQSSVEPFLEGTSTDIPDSLKARQRNLGIIVGFYTVLLSGVAVIGLVYTVKLLGCSNCCARRLPLPVGSYANF